MHLLYLFMLVLMVSIWCNGLQIVSEQGMILFPLRLWLAELTMKYEWFEYINKPLIGCIKCMASVWGLVFCYIFLQTSYSMLWEIPIVCVCSAAMNAVIYQLYDNPNV